MPRVARAVRAVPILAVVSMAAMVGLIVLVPSVAPAQTGPAPAPPPTDTSSPATPPAAPAASSGAPAKPVVPATGYGWSTKPAGHARARIRSTRAGATSSTPPNGTVIPGFETLADGSSRVFVQMPKPAAYAAKAARGTLTYVLKGVHIDRRNNLNALVTVHFNTPVTRARLVPHGSDLWLVLDLRENVQPQVAMDATKDGGAMLRVEFPKGDYLPDAPPAPAVTPADAATSPNAPAPAASSAPAAPASSASSRSSPSSP
jgi:hypothetical protein